MVKRGTDTVLVDSMNGDAIDLDVTSARGSITAVWLDSAGGALHNAPGVSGGGVVTIMPPGTAAGQARVGWLKK